MTYVQEEGGLVTEDDYPYKGWSFQGCNENKKTNLVSGTAPTKIAYGSKCEKWNSCDGMDEDSLAATLESKGPMVVAVNASPWQYYTGGVLSGDECNKKAGNGRKVLNHAVILTGYDIS